MRGATMCAARRITGLGLFLCTLMACEGSLDFPVRGKSSAGTSEAVDAATVDPAVDATVDATVDPAGTMSGTGGVSGTSGACAVTGTCTPTNIPGGLDAACNAA